MTRQLERPQGQPGCVRGPFEYPAVQSTDGTVRYWNDTTDEAAHWIVAPARLAETFEPGPEWQSRCDHIHGAAYRTCYSEAQCDSLARDDERTWGR